MSIRAQRVVDQRDQARLGPRICRDIGEERAVRGGGIGRQGGDDGLLPPGVGAEIVIRVIEQQVRGQGMPLGPVTDRRHRGDHPRELG